MIERPVPSVSHTSDALLDDDTSPCGIAVGMLMEQRVSATE